MTELTLEQLRFAQLNGLTFYTGGTGTYDNHQFLKDINGKAYCLKDNGTMFKAAEESAASLADVYKINFAPLDEAKQTGQQVDMVNKPPHYQTDNGIECIDAIRAALGLDGFIAYCRGNAIKYVWRAGKKDETAQDLRKAAWYLDRAAQDPEK